MQKLLKLGMMLLILSSCKGIKIEVCVLNGDGTSECTLSDGTPITKEPDQLENYVCTNPQDFEKLVKACKKQ